MSRREWFWPALLALTFVVAVAVYASTQDRSYACPLTGEDLPSPNCYPLNLGKLGSIGIYVGAALRQDE